MNKAEWLAEKCGFTWEKAEKLGNFFGNKVEGVYWSDPGWRYPDGIWGGCPPDFKHSLDALEKWVFPKIPGLVGFNNQIVNSENSPQLWSVEITCEVEEGDEDYLTYYVYRSCDPTLAEALFDACCEALGWEEPEGGN